MYLVYFPNEERVTREPYVERGMGCLFHEGDSDPRCAGLEGAGPDGQAGGTVSCPIPQSQLEQVSLSYLPDRQQWFQNKKEDYWIGWEEKPTPESLLREDYIDGVPLEMADGKTWGIPHIWSQKHVMDMDENENIIRRKERRYRKWYEESLSMVEMCKAQIHRVVTGKDPQPGVEVSDVVWDPEAAFQYLCWVLSLNYRVTPFLVAKLGLVEERQLLQSISVATDLAGVQELELRLLEGK